MKIVRNLKKFPNLHRKSSFMDGMEVGFRELMYKRYFVWNVMKYMDLQRNAMFSSNPPQ